MVDDTPLVRTTNHLSKSNMILKCGLYSCMIPLVQLSLCFYRRPLRVS
jgi:hypothetical protein